MEIKTRHLVGIGFGVIVIFLDFLFFYGRNSRFFQPVIAIGIVIGFSQFWLDFLNENKRQKEIELKFLEFVRGLVETVKSGIPIPKAILHVSKADYGALNPYIKKLANHIEWGIPLRQALKIFANDTGNKIILRAVSIVIEAERSGGNIDGVLRAVSNSIVQIKKIREERRSNTYSQMVQGYFIFFIFIAIMLTVQIYLFPQLADLTLTVSGGLNSGFNSIVEKPVEATSNLNFDNLFLGLVLIQGFFTGLMIGKFAEGEAKMGLKHSAVLVIISYIIITTFRGY